MDTRELNRKFGITDALRFDEGAGGLTRAVVSTPQAEAEVYLHGAHVTSWTPAGQKPVLFVSSRSQFAPGKPIRGGVPIAFPWFGPRGDGKPGPMHGFARILDWSVERTALRGDGALEIAFSLTPNDTTRSFGFDAFHLEFRVAFGAAFEMELETRNEASGPLTFEDALHTYFAVADIHQVEVAGLAGTTYIGKGDGAHRLQQTGNIIRFAEETNQLHLNTAATCTISDPVGQRRIVVAKSGSAGTVVWNPWVERAASFPDMAPEDWREMVCVETVNASDNAVTLPAGASHTTGATIRVE
jgi:glucose-6-phosphate 1-epimerase